MVSVRQVALPAAGGISLAYPNPLAVRSLRAVTWLGTLNVLALVFLLVLGGAWSRWYAGTGAATSGCASR